MTAALAAAGALAFITGSAIWFRRHPIWQGPGVRHPGSPPRPPRQHPAPRDWGESRLPSAADRTARFAAISDQAAGERVMPGRADGIPHADADQFLPPWEKAEAPVTPEPDLPPLPGRYLPASPPHACPDAPAAIAWPTMTEAEEHDLAQRFRDAFSEPQKAMWLPEDAPHPMDPEFEEWERQHILTAPDDTATDMRPVPAPVAAAENAAARWHLKAHVGYVMKRKPPLREYVEATIGPGVADLNPEYAGDAAAVALPPAEDFDSLLATARAGAVSERG